VIKLPLPLRRATGRQAPTIESAFAIVERVCLNVKRWHAGDQREKWVDSGLLVAESTETRVIPPCSFRPPFWIDAFEALINRSELLVNPSASHANTVKNQYHLHQHFIPMKGMAVPQPALEHLNKDRRSKRQENAEIQRSHAPKAERSHVAHQKKQKQFCASDGVKGQRRYKRKRVNLTENSQTKNTNPSNLY